ncbi:MAG: GIY-YIG nuclease family protein [Candidatus Omnitrophica bacterium]|nr:GIY-YIG nuclease family protein [Candidatus Omnitrophota bacterium]
MWYVYIIECQDGKLYIGMTEDVNRRFEEHQHHGSHFTSYNPAVRLLYTEEFTYKKSAAIREKQLKGWTRKKKLALITGDLKLLKIL